MGSLQGKTLVDRRGEEPWWKAATFYQLDYLHDLGVDCVWVCPIFESPQADMGYDVSDYQKIYAPYGTLADVDTLVRECHARQMKVILDLVVNHTSIKHPWFKESRSSKDNPKRSWYIWKPPRYDENGNRQPPTNWRGYFAGSTWAWDETTYEYYLHLYAPEQPDLNWDNPDCRAAIYQDTMRFWLDRGVDGFRIDTVNKFSKHADYADAPISDPNSSLQPAPEMWCNGPRIHEFIHEMNREVLAPYSAVSVGELSNTPDPQSVLPYVSAKRQELDMVFEFSVIRLGNGNLFSGKYTYQPFTLPTLKTMTEKWQRFIDGTDGWTTVFCENHDNGRAVSRFGDTSTTEFWRRSAKTLALWQTTMTGSLFLYQGQEIGMTNMPAAWGIKEYKDIEAVNFYNEALASGDQTRIEKTKHGLSILARDHSRIPFQWSDEPNAGFSSGDARPWMRVHDDYGTINVKTQTGDPGSVLEFYRGMLKLRKKYRDVFVFGRHILLEPEDEHVWVYLKEEQGGDCSSTPKRALVVMNFSREERPLLDVAAALGCEGEAVRFLVGMEGLEAKMSSLKGWESRIYCNFEIPA